MQNRPNPPFGRSCRKPPSQGLMAVSEGWPIGPVRCGVSGKCRMQLKRAQRKVSNKRDSTSFVCVKERRG